LLILRHGFGQRLSAEDVEVKVLDGLTSVVAAIGDHTVTVGDACGFGNFRNLFKDFCHDSAVL